MFHDRGPYLLLGLRATTIASSLLTGIHERAATSSWTSDQYHSVDISVLDTASFEGVNHLRSERMTAIAFDQRTRAA